MKNRILFVVENDYFPRDMRVYNECMSLAGKYSCFVLAPRQKGEKFIEKTGETICYRYPHFEAKSLVLTALEYLISWFWIFILVPVICLVKKIKIIHVANPPDFIVPSCFWLKIFGIKIIFDAHDLSLETFRGKNIRNNMLTKIIGMVLSMLEYLSFLFSNVVVTTNQSIKEYILKRVENKPVYIVRNSHKVQYRSIEEIHKNHENPTLHLGYFGVLANDNAAGMDNFFVISDVLQKNNIPFKISIIGSGPGSEYLQSEVKKRHLGKNFHFHGFIPIPDAFNQIKNFDFGLVTWGYLPKNHFHTAMKVMDYMACGVPVCSLHLKEQLYSTQNIGIHAENFEELTHKIIKVYSSKAEYELLRKKTLEHFNTFLCWENQEIELWNAYQHLLNKKPINE